MKRRFVFFRDLSSFDSAALQPVRPRVNSRWRAGVAGLLAASTLAFAQQTVTPADSASPGEGGWKRVGDQSQVYNPPPATNDAGQDPANADSNAAPVPQQTYPASNGNQNRRQEYPPANSGQGTYGQYGAAAPQQPYGGGQQQQQQPNYPPPPSVPTQLTVQTGTYLTVRINQTLSSDKNLPGDAFTASLAQPLVVNGVVVAEPGQTVGGRVVTAEKHHFDSPARLGLALTNLTLVDGQQLPINTQFVSRRGGTTSGGQEVGTVAATTGVGAAIGAIAGWGTGAAIGAGAGAAAGLIGVLVTRNHASVVYPEQILTFKLEAPATFSTANGTQAFRYVQPNEYDRPTYTNYGNSGLYQSGAPAPPAQPVYDYAYASPYWGWGYPYYWGPSFGFYGGYWGGRGYYGPRYYGGRFYGGGRYYGGGRVYAGGRFGGRR